MLTPCYHLRVQVKARHVILYHEVTSWDEQVVVLVAVLSHWTVESILASHCCRVVKQISLHPIAKKRGKVKVVVAARELANTSQ
mmetsp:Transcript_44536/g.59087  ORF Transcript_44536/g.59087 Transcript_44536/m.59087 type:complete len:84 (-) Transcript_44536:1336-1587(-)